MSVTFFVFFANVNNSGREALKKINTLCLDG